MQIVAAAAKEREAERIARRVPRAVPVRVRWFDGHVAAQFIQWKRDSGVTRLSSRRQKNTGEASATPPLAGTRKSPRFGLYRHAHAETPLAGH